MFITLLKLGEIYYSSCHTVPYHITNSSISPLLRCPRDDNRLPDRLTLSVAVPLGVAAAARGAHLPGDLGGGRRHHGECRGSESDPAGGRGGAV